MYETIIFDIDGTLLNTEEAALGSLQKLLKTDYGKTYKIEDLAFAITLPSTVTLKKLGIKDINKAAERWGFFLKEAFPKITVFDGITELLEKLKERDIVRGIVTAETKEELMFVLQSFDLMRFMTHIVCVDDTVNHKPHPEPLFKFFEISGAQTQTALYIGDSISDYECAQSAGIDFGLALWGCRTPDKIPAKYKFKSPLDIMQYVKTE